MTAAPPGLHPDDGALLARVADPDRNGVPDPDTASRRRRALEVARAVLGDALDEGAALSPLGAAWSGDLDLYLERDPGDLARWDWWPLDGLLARLGSPAEGRWAVVADGEVLGAVDLHRGPPPDPVEAVLARCRRRGEVRAREVLELRALARAGRHLDRTDPVVAAAAGAEAALGGRRLASARDGRRPRCPAPVRRPVQRRLRRRVGRARRRLHPRVVVALTGVDGSGKSTVSAALRAELGHAGVPTGRVWARPGMNVGALAPAARVAKRLLGRAQEPGVRAVARGEGAGVASRRGVLGRVWALAVTVAFVVDVWRQHLRAEGVVVYDRHVVDALVTLDFVYAGAGPRLPQALVRRLLPRASLTVHLEVPADVAVARKPGDTFGEHAVRAQLEAYGRRLPEATGRLLRLDATRPAGRNAAAVAAALLELARR